MLTAKVKEKCFNATSSAVIPSCLQQHETELLLCHNQNGIFLLFCINQYSFLNCLNRNVIQLLYSIHQYKLLLCLHHNVMQLLYCLQQNTKKAKEFRVTQKKTESKKLSFRYTMKLSSMTTSITRTTFTLPEAT